MMKHFARSQFGVVFSVLLAQIIIVAGNWGQWGGWGPCSVTCAGGDQSRSRTCLDSRFCSGTETNSRNCNNVPCPIHGGWENWESWTSCTRTCGGGTTSRERSCDAPSPAFGGRFCEGGNPQNIDNESVEWEWKVCNTFQCEGAIGPLQPEPLPTLPPTRTTASPAGTMRAPAEPDIMTAPPTMTTPVPQTATFDPPAGNTGSLGVMTSLPAATTEWSTGPAGPIVNGWYQWGEWGECSASCAGGDQSRTRVCADSNFCTGTETVSQNCNSIPCPIHGGWENWESWISCSKTCGGGTSARKRSCDAPSPAFGGRFCEGGVPENIDVDSVEWQWRVCNNFLCEGDVGPLLPVVLPTLAPSMTRAFLEDSTGPAAQVLEQVVGPEVAQGSGGTGGGLSGVGGREPRETGQETAGAVRPSNGVAREFGRVGVEPGVGRGGETERGLLRGTPTQTAVEMGQAGSGNPTAGSTSSPSGLVHGDWSQWSYWDSCSRTCGGGTAERTRICTAPRPSLVGSGCAGGQEKNIDANGAEFQWKICNRFRCPGVPANVPLRRITRPTLAPYRQRSTSFKQRVAGPHTVKSTPVTRTSNQPAVSRFRNSFRTTGPALVVEAKTREQTTAVLRPTADQRLQEIPQPSPIPFSVILNNYRQTSTQSPIFRSVSTTWNPSLRQRPTQRRRFTWPPPSYQTYSSSSSSGSTEGFWLNRRFY